MGGPQRLTTNKQSTKRVVVLVLTCEVMGIIRGSIKWDMKGNGINELDE